MLRSEHGEGVLARVGHVVEVGRPVAVLRRVELGRQVDADIEHRVAQEVEEGGDL